MDRHIASHSVTCDRRDTACRASRHVTRLFISVTDVTPSRTSRQKQGRAKTELIVDACLLTFNDPQFRSPIETGPARELDSPVAFTRLHAVGQCTEIDSPPTRVGRLQGYRSIGCDRTTASVSQSDSIQLNHADFIDVDGHSTNRRRAWEGYGKAGAAQSGRVYARGNRASGCWRTCAREAKREPWRNPWQAGPNDPGWVGGRAGNERAHMVRAHLPLSRLSSAKSLGPLSVTRSPKFLGGLFLKI